MVVVVDVVLSVVMVAAVGFRELLVRVTHIVKCAKQTPTKGVRIANSSHATRRML